MVLERDDVASSWRGHYDRLHLHTWRLLSCMPGLRISSERGPGRPLRMGGAEHPNAPGLHFVGYRNPMSGMFWEMSWEARRVAKAA